MSGWAINFLNLYRRQEFKPGLIGLHRAIAEMAPRLEGRLLDVGCGGKPYQSLFPVIEYIGLEIDTPEIRALKQADYYYDGESFPFTEQCFDGVICNQVLEHVFIPDQFLGEIQRVLKPGGKLLLTIPFVWDEHEQPWDYARYSSFGLKRLLEKNGFEVAEQYKINADVRVLFQLINAYLYKVLRTDQQIVNLLVCVLVMAPFNILGALLYRLLPANPDLYLDQLVLARKVAD